MTADLQSLETAFLPMLREMLERALSRRDFEADFERVLTWLIENLERVWIWLVEHLERALTWVVEHRNELMAGVLNCARVAHQGGVKVTAAKSTCSATLVLGEAIYAARARHSAKAAERLCL